jgi:hypothetical protein
VAATSANLPDPFILKVPGGYELYASQTGLYDEDIPTSFSKTFGQWGGTRSALVSVPAWATDGFDWAPDVRYLDGEYVMYFDSMAQPFLPLRAVHRHRHGACSRRTLHRAAVPAHL